jgi:hypothetical protein
MLCYDCNNNYKEIIENRCIFCNIIFLNKKEDVFNIIICDTKLSQNEIIKKSYEFFIKNNRIPYPDEIDPYVIIIKTNPYIYRKFNKQCKIFFTNCIDYNKIKTPRFPLKFTPQQLNLRYIMLTK